jgi:cytochrome oxidase Cu insertion factor (SCO1/SenC/PrrC family)
MTAALPPAGAPAVDAARTARGRWILLAIFAVCAAPVILGTLAFYFWQPAGRTNYGELLPLAPLRVVGTTADGAPFDFKSLAGQWVLVNVDMQPCDAACAEKLFFTRQTHVAQGAEAGRVERVWLTADPAAATGEKLAPTLVGARVVRPASADMLTPFGAAADKHVFLVDPLGNLMMRFPEKADPKRMIKDLQKLLRVNKRSS